MRAIVVDDSRSMRAIVSRQLRELGFEVHEAGSGQEALAKLNEVASIDLVLLDWNMPEMDGFEVLSLIRSEPAYKNVRVMMVTTESEMSQVSVALDAGANEYLTKPFGREALVEKLVLLGLDVNSRNL
jgi:two-component system, chemotaxis family, chemotaxis protein CheY